MRTTALEFTAKGELATVGLGDPPEPGPTEVLIETKYTGITNGTERHAFLTEHGFGGRFPSRHGYQQVGQVAAVGDEVTRYAEGDWVFFGNYVGHRGWNLVGQDEDLLLKLPQGIEHKHCALLGVAGVALSSVRQMKVSVGQSVWVVGQGPIGHFTAQSGLVTGAHVTVTDTIPRRLEAARERGIHVVLDASDASTMEQLRQGGPYDFIYDCCSHERLFFDVFENGLLARYGTIGATAVRKEATFPWSLLHGTRGKIEVSCHFYGHDLEVLLGLYQRGDLEIEPMVSHIVPIDEAPLIYEMLAERSHDLFGVIFDWTE